MAETITTVGIFLVLLAPLYVLFLRSLSRLSQHKSEIVGRICTGASQS